MKSARTRRIWLLSLFAGGVILLAARLAPPASADIGTCPVFPSNNVWNVRVDSLPVDANSNAYIQNMSPANGLHPDFGTVWNGAPNGIPYTTVPGSQPLVPITFSPNGYPDESDKGPFPIPTAAPIEGGPNGTGDRHVLVIDQGHCLLYELYQAFPQSDGSWMVDSSAKYDLNSNALRPDTWTSADAAGLPMFSGLVRYDEVQSGAINHAIRFTVNNTRSAHVWPARHDASSLTGAQYPPMGQRFRLKASVDISGYPQTEQVIFRAMQQYGLILADNGSDWYISGAPDSHWNDDELVGNFGQLHGSDFEAVDESGLMVDPNSGQAGPGPVWNLFWLPFIQR
ncbi:MAG: hypothetical protein WCF84_02500 [Anaerolineae bacterium]